MAGLIKELLLDYGQRRLPFDVRADITTAIDSLRLSGILSQHDLRVLNDYISGYTAREIAIVTMDTEERVSYNLARIITAIESASGYTDVALVRKIESNKNYPRYKIPVLSQYLIQHGRVFTTHDI